MLGPVLTAAGHLIVVPVLAMDTLGGPVNKAHSLGDISVYSGNFVSATNTPGNNASLHEKCHSTCY